MSIGEDLICFLTAQSTIACFVANRVHQNHMPERSSYPAIWFQRAGQERLMAHDGPLNCRNQTFDLECLSTDIDTAIDLATSVDDLLAGYRGVMGDSTVMGVFIEDKDDDYIPRGNAADEGVSVIALDVTIWF